MSELRRTPLHAAHRRHHARMVPFTGFELPVQYTSIRQEHEAVRERAGLFDVSHMGQLHFSGPGASATLENLITCHVENLRIDRARYGLMLNEAGGCIDDVMLTRLGDERFFLCVNAANVDKVRTWVQSHVGKDVVIEDRSNETALLALQGPLAATTLAKLAPDLTDLPKRFCVKRLDVAGASALVSGTGYTGAPGFEVYLDNADAEQVFDAILEAGSDAGVIPAGLGARDSLRIEAALSLYGHELDESTSPFEAGLDRFVKPLDIGFIGSEALKSRRDDPHQRCLVGFEMTGRGIARADYEIVDQNRVIGRVTSGVPSPTLGKSIGLGYVPHAFREVGQRLSIRIRAKDVDAVVVKLPFLRAD